MSESKMTREIIKDQLSAEKIGRETVKCDPQQDGFWERVRIVHYTPLPSHWPYAAEGWVRRSDDREGLFRAVPVDDEVTKEDSMVLQVVERLSGVDGASRVINYRRDSIEMCEGIADQVAVICSLVLVEAKEILLMARGATPPALSI